MGLESPGRIVWTVFPTVPPVYLKLPIVVYLTKGTVGDVVGLKAGNPKAVDNSFERIGQIFSRVFMSDGRL